MTALRVGGLFAGVGGLEMGLSMVLDVEPVWFSEIDKAATRVLAHRYPGVPNHGDITRIDWAQVEPVHILTAGWPCQPFSLAGKQKGQADERALWPEVARAVRALRPRLVVLENVAAIATAGELGRATADLAAVGYVGSWRCLRASDVGAPHRRERIFIAAYPDSGAVRQQPIPIAGGCSPTLVEPSGHDAVADAERGRRNGRSPDPLGGPIGRVTPARGSDLTPTHPQGDGRNEGRPEPTRELRRPHAPKPGRDVDWREFTQAIRRWECVFGQPVPHPVTPGKRGRPQLSGRLDEWLMGYPAGWITDVPGISNNDALRLCGNGVVPQQAAAALRLMLNPSQAAA